MFVLWVVVYGFFDYCGDVESGRYYFFYFFVYCVWCYCGIFDIMFLYCVFIGDWYIGNSVNDWCLVVFFY